MSAPRVLRVLELYSGIGGMHCALKESDIQYTVVEAIDVNTNANKVYKHNFPDTDIVDRAIEVLSAKMFEKLNIDMILMSPPCQPFTRVGKQQDTADVRTKSFLHVLDLLKSVPNSPSYILVENVKGFETSETRGKLLDVLRARDYHYQEMLLTPLQFGIPNSRLRYFLLAKKAPLTFTFQTKPEIVHSLPDCPGEWLSYKSQAQSDTQLMSQSEQQYDHCKKCICGGYHGNKDVDNNKMTNDLNHHEIEPSSKACENRNLTTRSSSSSTCSFSFSPSVAKRMKTEAADKEDRISDNGEETTSQADTPCKTGDIVSHCHQANSKEDFNIPDRLNDCSETKCSQNEKIQIEPEGSASNETDKDIPVQVETFKSDPGDMASGKRWECLENYGHIMRQSREEWQISYGQCLKVHNFLEDELTDRDLLKSYLVPDKDLKRFVIMDIVNPCSRKTNCFTKRYVHYMEGAGSVIQMTRDIQNVEHAVEFKQAAVEMKNRDAWKEADLDIIRQLNLRYFTPREIANILCFPKTYNFPKSLTNRQLYMLLGNSLNVHMVSVLIKIMTLGDTDVTSQMINK